jgi:5-methylcytosine-specific restriction endonuclease McrA
MMLRYRQIDGWKVPVVSRTGTAYRHRLDTLCEAQNWHCCYCGIVMIADGPQGDDSASIEHVVPKTAGGSDTWDNLVAACRLCNNARSAMQPEKYLRFVQWMGRRKAARYAHRLRARIQARTFRQRVKAKIYINTPWMCRAMQDWLAANAVKPPESTS